MKRFDLAALQIAILTLIVATLQACGKKEDPPAPPVVALQTTPSDNQSAPTVEQALDAMLRAHRADKICYDTSRDAYFMHYKEPAVEKSDYAGWYFVEKVNFYPLAANRTFFVVQQSGTQLIPVGPDVDGLPCKDKK